MFSLLNFMNAVRQIGGAVIQNSPAVMDLVQTGIKALKPADQAEAKALLADIQADNDAGFARLDAKLAEAERR